MFLSNYIRVFSPRWVSFISCPTNRIPYAPPGWRTDQLKSMARDLLEASRTSLPTSMLGVYEALKAIEGYPKAPLPIMLLPASPSVEDLSSGGVSLLVRGAGRGGCCVGALDGGDGSHDGDCFRRCILFPFGLVDWLIGSSLSLVGCRAVVVVAGGVGVHDIFGE